MISSTVPDVSAHLGPPACSSMSGCRFGDETVTNYSENLLNRCFEFGLCGSFGRKMAYALAEGRGVCGQQSCQARHGQPGPSQPQTTIAIRFGFEQNSQAGQQSSALCHDQPSLGPSLASHMPRLTTGSCSQRWPRQDSRLGLHVAWQETRLRISHDKIKDNDRAASVIISQGLWMVATLPRNPKDGPPCSAA